MSATALSLPCTVSEVDAELCRRGLLPFVECAWGQVEPKPFVPSWHIDCICEHLEAVSRGEIQNIIINVPPKHTKSLLACVFWVAWEWGPNGHPEVRWMFSTYAKELSTRDSVKCRRLIQSNWYQRLWGDQFYLVGDQNAKTRYENNRGGYRLATSVEGVGTGEGGDRIVVDDANKVKEREEDAERSAVISWWDGVMPTRGDSPKDTTRVIIQQRTHEEDLTGHILDTTPEDYELLVLPLEYEGKSMERTTTGFKDPRSKKNEIICPDRFPPKEVARLKKTLGSQRAAGQLQQRPAPAEGNIFKKKWFQRYESPPKEFDFVIQSWDMAFKDTKSSSYVCGEVWGYLLAQEFLLDVFRERIDFINTIEAVRTLSTLWPEATAKYVEDKANGPAVISALENKVSGLIAVTPEGSKVGRAWSTQPKVEAGNVWIPEDDAYPWVKPWVHEVTVFPDGRYNDQVDAFTQASSQADKIRERRAKNSGELPPIGGVLRADPFAAIRR